MPWPYGNPKSITGLLHFTDNDRSETVVVGKDELDKESHDQITLNHLLSDLLEIYGSDNWM